MYLDSCFVPIQWEGGLWIIKTVRTGSKIVCLLLKTALWWKESPLGHPSPQAPNMLPFMTQHCIAWLFPRMFPRTGGKDTDCIHRITEYPELEGTPPRIIESNSKVNGLHRDRTQNIISTVLEPTTEWLPAEFSFLWQKTSFLGLLGMLLQNLKQLFTQLFCTVRTTVDGYQIHKAVNRLCWFCWNSSKWI